MNTPREVGVVQSVTAQGVGFIRRSWDSQGNRREDVFFHAAECNNVFDELGPGTKVSFEVELDDRGRPEAIRVIPEK